MRIFQCKREIRSGWESLHEFSHKRLLHVSCWSAFASVFVWFFFFMPLLPILVPYGEKIFCGGAFYLTSLKTRNDGHLFINLHSRHGLFFPIDLECLYLCKCHLVPLLHSSRDIWIITIDRQLVSPFLAVTHFIVVLGWSGTEVLDLPWPEFR